MSDNKELYKNCVTPAATQRQRQIEDCLKEMMLEGNYDDISVADICRRAEISRKAFYRYYVGRDACLCAVIDRMIREAILDEMAEIKTQRDPLYRYMIHLEFWKGQREFLDSVIKSRWGMGILMARVMEFSMTEDHQLQLELSTPELESDEDVMLFFISSQMSLIINWHIRGYDTPVEEMAKKLVRLTYSPLLRRKEEE